MSFIASMVAAAAASAGLVTAGGIGAAALGAAATGAAGAGLGAGISAATGGDIGEGALMGGIGGLGAGAGAALGGATMGASAIGAQGAAATPFAAAAPVAGAVAPTATTAGAVAPTATTTVAPTATTTVAPTATTTVAPTATTTTTAANPALTSAANPAPVVHGPIQASQGALDPGVFAAKNVAANEANASWGSQLLSKAGIADAGQTGNAIGGKALENAVYGAGINGLLAGAQGKDVGRGMLTGAVSGGVGGAAAGGLGQMGNTVGQFAANNPGITSALVGGATNMALDNALTSDPTMPEERGIRANVKWDPSVYRPYGPQFAAGGITDLDNYDQSPQMQSPGTLDIPNRNEVTNNQGYMGDSVQMMAHGGVAEESYMLEGVGGKNLHREASKDLQEYLKYTPDTELTPEQRRQKAILFGNGMAHGGISDLGGYSDGGRLLKGPGDGVSDDIPASIGGKQPARLAEGEFVVPARIVSELGNGSTDAGAKRLYQMMDRIQSDRRKTTGKGKFSDNPKAYKHLPA